MTAGQPDKPAVAPLLRSEWSAVRRAHRARRLDLGLCARCSTPSVPGKTLCGAHAASQARFDAAYRRGRGAK
jgi:hypothetical protein